ncbi:hypothetical protein AZE42_03649, partial [Rhizopogon vesiculosus]
MAAFGNLNLKKSTKVHGLGVDELPTAPSPVKPPVEPPIHRLPLELLHQTLLLIVYDVPKYPSVFSLGERSYRDYSISANLSSPPLLLTQVALPSKTTPLEPSLASLLGSWLSRSGSQPLTLCIHDKQILASVHWAYGGPPFSETNYTLLKILLSERKRWETVTFASSVSSWRIKSRLARLDTPKLRTLTLERDIRDIKRFNAPNLTCLRLGYLSDWGIPDIPSKPTPTTKKIRYLYFGDATAHAIRSTAVVFPHLKTLAVDQIGDSEDAEAASNSSTHSFLEIQSMTLPISPHIRWTSTSHDTEIDPRRRTRR